MSTFVRLLIAAAVALAGNAAPAQSTRLRGTIASVDAAGIAFTSADGQAGRLVLAPGAAVIAVVKASLSDIHEGTFLGSAAVPQPDGRQRAIEVHIFPESMRGVGEGHRAYAPVAQGTMTNGATAGRAVTGIDGSTLTVTYAGGTQKIVVPPDAPIVRYEVGGAPDLQPGARFTVSAARALGDGRYEASRISVGRDGVVPQ